MPKEERELNRHHLRVWIKLALENGALEKLPPRMRIEGNAELQDVSQYARQLLEELSDRESSHRALKEILADARRFRAWVEARQKDCVRHILTGPQPDDSTRRARLVKRAPVADETSPSPQTTRQPVKPEPKLHPLWDKWIDAHES
jgi:hypothetical protein